MTGSNVSNMLIAGTMVQGDAVVSSAKSSTAGMGSFEMTLQSFSGISVESKDNSLEIKASENSSISVESPKAKVEIKESEGADSKANELSDEEIKSLSEEIEKFENEVKDVITKELDITEEELEEVMELLGLTFMDLLEPNNLAQVVLELDKSVDTIGLLVREDFKNILDSVNEIFNQFVENTGISKEFALEIEASVKLEILSEEEVNIPVDFESKVEVPIKEAEAILITPEVKETATKQEEIEITDDLESVEVEDNDFVIKTETNENSEDTMDFSSNEKNEFKAEIKHENENSVTLNDSPAISFTQTTELNYSIENDSVALPTGETVSTAEIIDQIVEQARVTTMENNTTMEIVLNPEGLGKIFMEVSQKGDEIVAKLFTENEVVKEALDNQMAALRTQISDSSTKVTSIEVSVGTHEFERNLEQDARREQEQNQNQEQSSKGRRNRIDLMNLDEISGLMTEEEQLVYSMMRENGNTLDYHA